MSKTLSMEELLKYVLENSGGTFSFVGLDMKTNIHKFQRVTFNDGFVVAKKGGMENIPVLRDIYIQDFIKYSMVGNHIGLWYDHEKAVWSIDEPVWRVDELHARSFAILNEQRAIYDVKNGVSIYV